jgi:L-malate glycosyltransferase
VRILQIIQKPQRRGAELFAIQLANSLIDAGHECIVVSLYPGGEQLPFQGRMIQLNRKLNTRLMDVSGWKLLSDLIRTEKIDVVQANAADTLKFAVFSRLIFQWKASLVFRNASVASLYIRKWHQKIFNKLLYQHTDRILSVTHASREDLVKLFPGISSRIKVIYNGITFLPDPGLKRRDDTLLHIGGFTFEKNHIGLIRIFKKVKASIPNARLWLVGDGPLRSRIETMVAAEQLGDSVTFFGYVSDPQTYLCAATGLLLPSVIEGLPAVILEAMYYQCPVVAYKVGGIHEVVQEGHTGTLIPQGDEKAFADASSDLIQNPQKFRSFAANAKNVVSQNFDGRVIANQFIDEYKSLRS